EELRVTRRVHCLESVAGKADPDLDRAVISPADPSERQVIEELVREHADPVRERDVLDALADAQVELTESLPRAGAALEGLVRELRCSRLARALQELQGERPVPRSQLDDRERVGIAESR